MHEMDDLAIDICQSTYDSKPLHTQDKVSMLNTIEDKIYEFFTSQFNGNFMLQQPLPPEREFNGAFNHMECENNIYIHILKNMFLLEIDSS